MLRTWRRSTPPASWRRNRRARTSISHIVSHANRVRPQEPAKVTLLDVFILFYFPGPVKHHAVGHRRSNATVEGQRKMRLIRSGECRKPRIDKQKLRRIREKQMRMHDKNSKSSSYQAEGEVDDKLEELVLKGHSNASKTRRPRKRAIESSYRRPLHYQTSRLTKEMASRTW